MDVRTNWETRDWLKNLSSQNLSMRDCLEEATLFFGTFKCDHRAFGPWREDFLQKEKKMKYEALQRIRRVVGGTGKQFYNPPSEYSPPVQKFGFIGEDLKCQKCGTRFECEKNVMIHIKHEHYEDFINKFGCTIIRTCQCFV